MFPEVRLQASPYGGFDRTLIFFNIDYIAAALPALLAVANVDDGDTERGCFDDSARAVANHDVARRKHAQIVGSERRNVPKVRVALDCTVHRLHYVALAVVET